MKNDIIGFSMLLRFYVHNDTSLVYMFPLLSINLFMYPGVHRFPPDPELRGSWSKNWYHSGTTEQVLAPNQSWNCLSWKGLTHALYFFSNF